ncbi:hypothetical protein PybrP1_009674 [[Pythium] brassicae (nom. inval.)]|nr:hypothetical protein PybrP1_009674 [[Pythium] brassicae (nom. inval.)]
MDSIAAFYGSDSSSSPSDSSDEEAAAPLALEDDADASDADTTSGRKRKREGEESPAWIRAFAHVEGNWPSHVHVIIGAGDAELRELCGRVVSRAQQELGTRLALVPMDSSELGGVHLSLSRPFTLRYEQITPFVLELRAALKWRRRFVLSLAGATVLVNDERTRSFLALRVADGEREVLATLKCVDACMKHFALPVYYEDPIPHVSIASCLGASLPEQLPPNQVRTLVGDEAPWTAAVTAVHVAIGNKQFRIPLV